MSESRKGTFLKQCQKCHIDMNGDMLDAQGVCLRCRAQAKEEQQKYQKGIRDSAPYNVNEMTETEPAYSDFITCDRSGRRNAIHDLRGDSNDVKLEKLTSSIEENQVKEDANEKESEITSERNDGNSAL